MESPTYDTAGHTWHSGSGDSRHLRRRVAELMKNYPDLRSLTYKAAQGILKKHTLRSLDPLHVYWHRFDHAMSSPNTFTGWEHRSRPVESMNLIELLMQRFSAADQDSPDELDVNSGFYNVGPDQLCYDERNEVPMLPSTVLADFWALNFSSQCRRKVDQFWNEHSQDFCLFAKVRLLSSAGMALSRKQLSILDYQTILMALTGGTDSHVTFDRLQRHVPSGAGASIIRFELAGHGARNTVCISRLPRRILYCPDDQLPFICFDDDDALARWVKVQLAEPATTAALALRFMRDQTHQAAFVKKLLKVGYQVPATAVHAQDVFLQLRDCARQEMQYDVHRQLTSNSSLRKQMWISYLGAFIQIAGALAPIGWPVALTLIGAGIASVGLNIDQAVNGNTAQLRKAGIVGAIVNSVYLFLNLPLLADLRRPVLPVQTVVEVAEAELPALETLKGNVVLEDTPASVSDMRYRNVHVLDNGECWIRLGEHPFRVQYVQDLKLWFIVHPDNPFSFSGARLVRLNEANEWELVGHPGLRGGRPMDAEQATPLAFETVSSSFWDIYMQFNLPEEERLSALGMQRQETLVGVYETVEDDAVVTDSDGEDVAVDGFGEKHRIFKTPDDWFGGTITRYTEDEDAYNVFLRTGQRKGSDQVGVIQRLVEDLAEVDFNNDVALYRGGSGNRGTSGKVFRDGKFKAGDVLVNTDITSFSENPYISRVFASSQGGAASETFRSEITFDETAVVFELPAGQYLNATPISRFSVSPEEVESVFLPGHYFEIQRVQEVVGARYRFMNVQLKQIPPEQVAGAVYDLRSGAPFNREQYAAKLGAGAQTLVDRFFPTSHSGVAQNH